jgi:hypothetical protein
MIEAVDLQRDVLKKLLYHYSGGFISIFMRGAMRIDPAGALLWE